MPITALICILYPAIIQYRRGGLYLLLAPLALVFAVLDVLANYTEWSLVFGRPAKGDWTITHRLRRMEREDKFPARQVLAGYINTFLHACEHDGRH